MILKKILDFVFPIYCVGCRFRGVHFCKTCLQKFPKQLHQTQINNLAGPGFNIFFSINFEDKSPIAELIHRFKYNGAKEIGEILGTLLNNTFTRPTFLVPVPLHRRRLNSRGFNQSLILAQQLARKWDLPVSDILQRHRYTKPQVELNGLERLTNVTDAFSMKNPAQHLNPEINYILIDDVCTTGATLGECVKILRRHGAEKILAAVVAKT